MPRRVFVNTALHALFWQLRQGSDAVARSGNATAERQNRSRPDAAEARPRIPQPRSSVARFRAAT
eukprot:2173291-Rhodomonas_salina.6